MIMEQILQQSASTQNVVDAFGRPLKSLRLSVTDRCNLRCSYCMPEEEYVWLPRDEVLAFEEMNRLVDVFVALGVDKVRLTGGEPLLRRDLPALVTMLAAKPGLRDLAMTTNGVLLAAHAPAARGARPGAGGHRLAGARRLHGHQARHGGHARGERRRGDRPHRVRAPRLRRGALHRV